MHIEPCQNALRGPVNKVGGYFYRFRTKCRQSKRDDITIKNARLVFIVSEPVRVD